MRPRIRSLQLPLIIASLTMCGWPARAQTPPPTPTSASEPTLEQRLDRLCQQLDSQRESFHIPGAAIAVVKDDQVILSRGFGLRDVENNLPVTDDTLFAIGSSTKAFTATLIGMLIDEGRMTWDDPVRKHLPDFHLKDPAANEQITIRDLLCHRSGLARTDLLWASGAATRQEILQIIANAELFTPFREKFNYNNVTFLAAGEAAGRAASSDWDTLVAQRIFKPLGMNHTNTSLAEARKNPLLARGYQWDDDKKTYKHLPMRDLNNIAPAGAINSNVRDMAQWVRFQLNKGAVNGQALIQPERIDETWTKQITMAGDVDYGLGWMLRTWNGRRYIEHGGNIDGFGADVGFLPDDHIGFVLLTNVTATPLQATVGGIVFDALLGSWDESKPPLDVAQVQPYLGKYHFDVLKTDVTVLVQNGRLAVDVPGQMVFELKPPDQEGKWYFDFPAPIAVSFIRNDTGDVIELHLFQAGLEFELPREGVTRPVEVTLADAQKYLGTYHSEKLGDLKVLHRDGRLAVDVPKQLIFDLKGPDSEGKWAMRAKKSATLTFNSDASGAVVSMTLVDGPVVLEMPRIEKAPADALPSLDELISLQKRGYGTDHLADITSLRMAGTITFINQGISGRISMIAADNDRFIQTLDMGKFGRITLASNTPKAWSDSTFHGFEELEGKQAVEARRQSPLLLAGDWRTRFDKIDIDHIEMLNGRKMYALNVVGAADTTSTIYLSADTGLAEKEDLSVTIKGVGSLKSTITYDDYRDINGIRVPVRFTVENEANGKMVATIDTVEANFELAPNAFAPPNP